MTIDNGCNSIRSIVHTIDEFKCKNYTETENKEKYFYNRVSIYNQAILSQLSVKCKNKRKENEIRTNIDVQKRIFVTKV